MREILFRGKRVDNGEWVYGNYIEDKWGDDSGNTIYGILQDRVAPSMVELWVPARVSRESVGQYTGLTDKNGEKIFEGDIVKGKHTLRGFICEDVETPYLGYGLTLEELGNSDTNRWLEASYYRNYGVQFYRGCYRVKNKNVTHYISPSYIYNHELEVIGNIHDNPELLEVKS